MKTKFKTSVLLGAAFSMLLLFTACPNAAGGGGGGPVPKVKVTLKKTVGGNVKVTPELPEDGMVSQYTNLTFKALPLTGYKFTKWELDDGETVNEAEYRHSVKKAVKIKAVFTEDDPAIITKHTVTLNPTTKGTVTSDIEPWPNDNQLPEDTEITFTAEPDEDYAVDKWTVTPNSALQAGGTAESATARVKITAATTVEVTFRPTERTYTAGSVSFTMKSIAAVTNGTIGHDERPNNKPHTVNLSAYLIGETEVTQELYQAVMGNNPSFHQGAGHLPDGEEVQEKRPVEKVNWYHAIAFCNKLSLKLGLTPCYTVTVSGSPINFSTLAYTEIPTADNSNWNNAVLDMSKNGFRLPTEAEWEWAAKGGTDDKWAGTNIKSELKNYAWYKNADGGDANGKTHEVKKKLPNGYGLYDMSGNVYEWCWDWYKNETPAGGQTDPMGVDSGFERVKRGGSWDFTTFNAARAYRDDKSLPDNCNSNNLGLRLACRP